MTQPAYAGQPVNASSLAASTSGIAGLDPSTLNAQELINSVLAGWGLQDLAPTALSYIQQGYTSDAIQFLLQSTPQFQQRFPANKIRIQNGLAPLSPAEYIATERSYKQIMSSAGLPQGYWDSPQHLSDLIGKDVSPSELQQRVSEATTFVNQTDPTAREALQGLYGIDSGHLVAHYLDESVAAPILAKQTAAAQIGGAALAQGLALTSRQRAETYADQGVTQAQALSGYQHVAAVLPGEQAIAGRFGQTYTQGQAEDEFLGGLASAARARQQLNAQEKAQFAGDTGQTTTLYGNQGRASAMTAATPGGF